LVGGHDPKHAVDTGNHGNSNTTMNTDASLRTYRTRQALSQQREGWEDAGLHDPWAMSSLHSSLNTLRSSFSNSLHNESAMTDALGGNDAIAPPGFFRYTTTPITNAVPEGDKLSLRDIPFSEEVSVAIQQHKMKFNQQEDQEGENSSSAFDKLVEDEKTVPSPEEEGLPLSSNMGISFAEESTEEHYDDVPCGNAEADVTTHHDLMSAVTDENMLTEEYAMDRLHFLFPDESFGEVPIDFPRFEKHEIETGKRLGRGGFSDVDEIRHFHLQAGHHSGSNMEAFVQSRDFVHSRCLNGFGESRFALKQLRDDIKKDPARAWTGMVDLIVEVRILLHMQHPHILKLRGVAQGNPFQPDFFLILDRLAETLSKRLERWKAKKNEYKTNTPLLLRPFVRKERKEKAAELWRERLQNAYELTSALQHMHSHRVIHRKYSLEMYLIPALLHINSHFLFVMNNRGYQIGQHWLLSEK
jgi:hypothetical protein